MKGDHIYYKSGYKYQLYKDYTLKIPIELNCALSTEFIFLAPTGYLTIWKGYCWDGPSGPTLDTSDSMRGSLVHDSLYQLMRMGLLDRKWRKTADKLLRDICLEDGMIKERAEYWYDGVQDFALEAATVRGERPVMVAPQEIDYSQVLEIMARREI